MASNREFAHPIQTAYSDVDPSSSLVIMKLDVMETMGALFD